MRMTIKLRSAFTLYWIQSEEQWSTGVGLVNPLREAGYQVVEFSHINSALAEVFERPPHFIVLFADSSRERTAACVLEFQQKLPETQIILLLPEDQDFQLSSYYALGVYDCLLLPVRQPSHLVRSVDRAAETNCWMYRREQQDRQEQQTQEVHFDSPLTSPQSTDASSTAIESALSFSGPSFLEMLYELDQKEESPQEEKVLHSEQGARSGGQAKDSSHHCLAFRSWLEGLYGTKTVEDAAEHFLTGMDRCLGVKQGIYLKYYTGRRSLLAVRSLGLKSELLQGLGINLNTLEDNFDSAQLVKPDKIASLRQMVDQVLSWPAFETFTLSVNNEIVGIFILPSDGSLPRQEQLLKEDLIQLRTDLFMALRQHCELIEARKRLHKAATSEAKRGLLARSEFLDSLVQEVSRSRRTQLPVSLLVFYVESHGAKLSEMGVQDRDLALRLIGQILREHSRVNDFVGQLAFAEFGVLLPHTSVQGAAIKAERLRRQLELADFSKVLRAVKGLQVSVGVSEYPSLSQDAEELFQSADAVLYNMRIHGLNRVCVAEVARPQNPVSEELI